MSAELPKATDAASTDALEQHLIERIRKGAIELPLLPQVASRILSMVYDPDAEAAKLAALIHQDQALAAHVIRIANSPAYMTRNPVVSLQHAVSMLGMNLMSELAFSASIKGSAFKVPGWDDEVKRLWQYSLASGAYAKEIARVRRFNVESAYLCGLLHRATTSRNASARASRRLLRSLMPASPSPKSRLARPCCRRWSRWPRNRISP